MEHSYHSLENPGMRRVEARNGLGIKEVCFIKMCFKSYKMNERTSGD